MTTLLTHTRPFVEVPENASNVPLPRHMITVKGPDSFIELFSSLLSYKVPVHTALSRCAELCTDSKLRAVARELVSDTEGGALISQAMRNNPKFFGKLSTTFVDLGERGYGLPKSLSRYLDMQAQREVNSRLPKPQVTTRRTRDFALIAGTLMDLGTSLPDALELAAVGKSRRFRDSVHRTVKLIEGGEELSDSLEERGWPNPFRFGFDKLFINTVRLGEETNSLGRMLVEFGSKTWSLRKL